MGGSTETEVLHKQLEIKLKGKIVNSKKTIDEIRKVYAVKHNLLKNLMK
jgi:hypothetical protein